MKKITLKLYIDSIKRVSLMKYFKHDITLEKNNIIVVRFGKDIQYFRREDPENPLNQKEINTYLDMIIQDVVLWNTDD